MDFLFLTLHFLLHLIYQIVTENLRLVWKVKNVLYITLGRLDVELRQGASRRSVSGRLAGIWRAQTGDRWWDNILWAWIAIHNVTTQNRIRQQWKDATATSQKSSQPVWDIARRHIPEPLSKWPIWTMPLTSCFLVSFTRRFQAFVETIFFDVFQKRRKKNHSLTCAQFHRNNWKISFCL